MHLIEQYGLMWARNQQNVKSIPRGGKLGRGVYVLYDGSLPMYVGRGKIRERIEKAWRSKRRGKKWDHFSWFAVTKPELEAELEALLICMLPYYLRLLNRRRESLSGDKQHQTKNRRPDLVRGSGGLRTPPKRGK